MSERRATDPDAATADAVPNEAIKGPVRNAERWSARALFAPTEAH